MQELVDDIKNLRARHRDAISDSVLHFMHTINRLVDLVGEMRSGLHNLREWPETVDYFVQADKLLIKSSQIAALAKEHPASLSKEAQTASMSHAAPVDAHSGGGL